MAPIMQRQQPRLVVVVTITAHKNTCQRARKSGSRRRSGTAPRTARKYIKQADHAGRAEASGAHPARNSHLL